MLGGSSGAGALGLGDAWSVWIRLVAACAGALHAARPSSMMPMAIRDAFI
jgi:hypothetical protein